MRELKLKKTAPVVVRLNDWNEMEDGSFRCGNVVIRCDSKTSYGGHTFETWHIYCVGRGGKLIRVYAKSRPWGYGHAGQAKIGANHLAEPIDGRSP